MMMMMMMMMMMIMNETKLTHFNSTVIVGTTIILPIVLYNCEA
jgi:hypothetical protein